MNRRRPFCQALEGRLALIRDQGLYRVPQAMVPTPRGTLLHQGQEYLNLAGNDYLGLAVDSEQQAVFRQWLRPDWAIPGATGSRLMTGTHPLCVRLEERLGRLYGTGPALVCGSGYHANVGILPALTGRDDVILADKLCHASLIDGMRLSRARLIRYPHLDLERLEELLKRYSSVRGRVFVVTESVFSMDGDIADLQRLVELKARYGAVLYVDEAHAVGVRGHCGLGCAEEQGVLTEIDLLIGTFGKAWGGVGAFCLCSAPIREMLVNASRSFIFSTALPPVSLAWLLFVVDHWQEYAPRRRRLLELTDRLRRTLAEAGVACRGQSHIVPILIGTSEATLAAARMLRQRGFWVGAVRPPTVPSGTGRLRLSLSAAHDWSRLERLVPLLEQLPVRM